MYCIIVTYKDEIVEVYGPINTYTEAFETAESVLSLTYDYSIVEMINTIK